LRGKHLRQITVDGCPGLLAALKEMYPFQNVQRCLAHRLRNVVVKLKRHQRGPVTAECKPVFAAASKPEAIRRFRAWAELLARGSGASRALPGERFLPPAALLRLSSGTVEEDSHDQRAGADLSRVPTTHAAHATVSEPGECGEDLLRRDRLPQPELGGAPSMTKFHKTACITTKCIRD
jgi:hypothetical protein